MASNPFDDNDPAIRERIERRAYHLSEDDGHPHGRHDEYWERARELVHMELAGNTAQLPNPATVPGADPNAPDVIEEASIQDNLGEFPDRFADQGEKSATPKARPVARPRKKPEPAPAAKPAPAPAKAQAKPAKVEKPAPAAKPAKAATPTPPPAPAKAPAPAPAKATAKSARTVRPEPAAKPKPAPKKPGKSKG